MSKAVKIGKTVDDYLSLMAEVERLPKKVIAEVAILTLYDAWCKNDVSNK